MKIRRPIRYNPSARAAEEGAETTNTEVERIATAIDSRLAAFEYSPIMPANDKLLLWWPCDDPIGATTLREVAHGVSGDQSMVLSATAFPSLAGGLVQDECVRLYGADATRGASTGVTGSPGIDAVTISCWARAGSAQSAAASILFGYWNAAGGSIFTLYLDTEGTPVLALGTTGGGAIAVTAQSDSRVSRGDWHHYMGTYNGATPKVYVDGIETAGSTAADTMNWTAGANQRWKLGFPTSANSMYGLIQDCRVHAGAMPQSWAIEAHARGRRTFRG